MLILACFLSGCQEDSSTRSGNSCERCVQDAAQLLDKNKPHEAMKILEGYVRLHGQNSEISEMLAKVCLAEDDKDLAAYYFEETASIDELKYYCYLKAADIYEERGEVTQALRCCRQYLKIFSEDQESQLRYANLLLKNGDKKQGLCALVACPQKSANIYMQIASLFHDFGNYVQARNGYLAALSDSQIYISALRRLWDLYHYLDDVPAIVSISKKLMDIGESSYKGVDINHLLSIYETRNRVLELLTTDIIAAPMGCSLPKFVAEKTEPIVPVTDVPKVLTKKERAIELKQMIAESKSRGEYEQAIANLWKILGINSRDVDSWVELTDCLIKVNKYDIAEMTIQEAIKFRHDVGLYKIYLDIVLRTRSSLEYAKIVHEVKQKFPLDPDIRLLWARAQEMCLRNASGAQRSYEKFLQIAPSDHPDFLRIQKLLETYKR